MKRKRRIGVNGKEKEKNARRNKEKECKEGTRKLENLMKKKEEKTI